MPQTAWMWSLVLAALIAAPARSGVIRGKVRLPAFPRTAHLEAYPGRAASLASPREALRGAPGDAVISVVSIPSAAESALARRDAPPRLAQQRQTFVPRVLAIARGTTVEFPNLDPIFHNVFSVSPVRRFDLGKYPRGQSRRVRFDKAGVVDVFCDIHANMTAFIVVLPNHAFTTPDERGSFALPDLPAGTYTVEAWHPDLETIRRKVTLPEEGDVVIELDF